MMRVIALAVILTTLAVAQTAPSTVSATGKVSSHFTAANDLVPFAFTIRNDTASELKDLRIMNPHNEYWLEQLSLDPSAVCDGVKSPSVYRPLPPASGGLKPNNVDQILISQCLPAGQSVVAWGSFRAMSTHKPETLLVVLLWKTLTNWKTVTKTKASGRNTQSGSEGKEYSLVVDLGENEVRTRWWVNVSDYLPYAAPVVAGLLVVALTFLFNRRLASNSRRTEVLKQMLTGMQNYTSKFYMPMSSAAAGLEEELSKNPKNPATPQSFFFFLLLQRTMLDTLGEIGGVFFSDQRGEALAAACWDHIFDWFYRNDRTSPFYLSAYAAAKVITPRSDYQEFSRRFVVQSKALCMANPALKRCWTEFTDSMKQHEKSTEPSQKVAELKILLRAFSTVVDCEINRVNKYWYPSVVTTPAEAAILTKLRELAEVGEISWLKTFRYCWPWKYQNWRKAFRDFWRAKKKERKARMTKKPWTQAA
jgi:hypothetical protein